MKNLLIFSLVVTLFSCSTDLNQVEKLAAVSTATHVQIAGEAFNVGNQQELRRAGLFIARQLNLKEDEVNIVDAEFKEYTPQKGEKFNGLQVVFKAGDKFITSVTSVTSTPSVKGGRALVEAECTMSCNSSTFCNGCKMRVIEKCVEIECTCTKGGGDCDPSIIFP